MPERPPITNIETKPTAHSMGVLKWIFPSHIVASQEKTLIPVGTAISKVVIIIGTRSHGAMPDTNMWCAQTEKPSTRIAISDNAIRREPKIGLPEDVELTPDAITSAGILRID